MRKFMHGERDEQGDDSGYDDRGFEVKYHVRVTFFGGGSTRVDYNMGRNPKNGGFGEILTEKV